MEQDDVQYEQPYRAPVRRSPWSSTGIPAVLFLVAVSLLYMRANVSRNPKRLNIDALDIRTLSGNPLNPRKFLGKAVVLNFWAPWCGPCQIETPWLQQLQAAHPDDLLVIGVDQDPNTYAEAALFAASHKVTYPMVQTSGAMINAIGVVESLPTTFYIAPSGEVVHTAIGAMSEARMEGYVSDALRR